MGKRFGYHPLTIPFREFWKGIKNLYHYFNIIWKDRDYDYGYTIDILLFKLDKNLKRVRSASEEHIHLNPNKNQAFDDIEQAILLLRKWKNEEFSAEQHKILDEKYGEIHYDFEPYKKKLFKLKRSRTNINNFDEKEYDREFKIRVAWAQRQKERAKRDAFILIGKNIEFLWD